MLTPNQKLQNGRYNVIAVSERIGKIQNYKAFDNESQSIVLIKEFSEDQQNEEKKINFLAKISSLANINHRSLFEISNYFEEFDNVYIAFEQYAGDTLRKTIEKSQKPFPLNSILELSDQLLEAIGFLHNQSPPLIHRDIRPGNLFLTSDKSIKLSTLDILRFSDYGTIDPVEEERFESKNLVYPPLEQLWSGLDSASKNVILNNFDEQSQKALEQPIDAQSDIYSFGATLYYLATATEPIDSISRLIEVLDGNKDPLPYPHEINPEIPEDLSEAIVKALEIKRKDRYSASVLMRQVLQTVEISLEEKSVATSSVVKATPTRQPIVNETPPKNSETTQQIPFGQNQHLETLEQQLQKAEKKRIEAEKRALEAERLLQKQEALKTFAVTPKVIENENKEQNKILSAPKNKKIAEISQAKVLSNKVATDKASSPVEQENLDYFADLYEQPIQQNISFGKYIASTIILFIIGGFALGFWNFYGADLISNSQTVSNEAEVPAVDLTEKPEVSEVNQETPVQDTENLAEDSIDSLDNQETTENSVPEQINQTESQPNIQTGEIPAPRQNSAITRKKVSRPITRTPKNTRQTVSEKPKPRTAQPVPTKSKPAKPAKKTVTLDDLIKDN